ncbi:MAG: Ig-like domain-containing protein [Deltaproteobacteria bacterium]|nr:Ig-like domain-containing protein [Deltaproteobacteria bacterium]
MKSVCVLLGLALACTPLLGCGGVDVQREGEEPLKLLSLTPHLGETDVALDTEVVAVFSSKVVIGEEETQLNDNTFCLIDRGGNPVHGQVGFSELNQERTVVLSGLSLDPSASYEISIKGTIEGESTAAIGVEIRSSFTTGQ